MRFPRVIKGSRKSSSAALQNGEKKVVDGGAAGTNSRQVAPEETNLGGGVDYDAGSISISNSISSRDDAFFEACPWLDSDCDDEFYSVNGDLTPARSVASQQSGSSKTVLPPPAPGLPTLGAILKAEPLTRRPPQRKLGDLLRESQDGDGDLSRADSFRAGREAGRCCVPHLARAVSCNATARGPRRRNK